MEHAEEADLGSEVTRAISPPSPDAEERTDLNTYDNVLPHAYGADFNGSQLNSGAATWRSPVTKVEPGLLMAIGMPLSPQLKRTVRRSAFPGIVVLS